MQLEQSAEFGTELTDTTLMRSTELKFGHTGDRRHRKASAYDVLKDLEAAPVLTKKKHFLSNIPPQSTGSEQVDRFIPCRMKENM